MKPKVYLCGAIENAPFEGKSWRNQLKDSYGDEIEFLDPWDNDPDGVSNREVRDPESPYYRSDEEIMKSGREQIDESDALLIYDDGSHTWGSPREHEYVSEWGRGPDIPVVIVLTDPSLHSAWMCDAEAIVRNFDEAIVAIKRAIEEAEQERKTRTAKSRAMAGSFHA